MPRVRKAPAAPAAAAPVGRAVRGPRPPAPAQPLPILETDYVNTPLPNRRGDWPKKAAGSETFMTVNGPAFGWLSLHDHDNEFDVPLTGLSGTVVQKPEVSNADVPFLHPFGNDFEFHVAPDARYADLVAPKMIDQAYIESTARANNEFGLNVKGVIGMEIDSGFVPKEYQPQLGDRTCLWGRWIVDAGHDDFHTEIHPPLIMVSARPARSAQQAGLGGRVNGDATTVQIISRPYLVSQDFGDGGLLEHLVKEVAKVVGVLGIPLSLSVEAHPRLMPQPFVGLNIVTFKVRPPTPRLDIRDELVVEFNFTRRDDSTAIQVLRGSDQDSVRVIMVLNEAGYVAPPEPRKTNFRITLDDLEKMDRKAGDIYRKVVFASILGGLHAPIILNKGIETHKYSALRAPTLGNPTRVSVERLGPVNVPIDNTRAFPVAGTLKVEWQRFGPAGPVGGQLAKK
jgi:hypothetical protein